jgi:hypothetical protein
MNDLQPAFAAIGARIKVCAGAGTYALDINRDRAGEYFELSVGRGAPDFHVLHLAPRERHLLLFASDGHRFLCGYEERHWFVAAIRDRISTVTGARVSLLPPALRGAVHGENLRKRRTKLFVRQGEWFFVPAQPRHGVVHRDEPLFRDSRSKPHRCQFVIRYGGELVHFAGGRAYTEAEFTAACAADPTLMARRTQSRVRNPKLFARGYVRHPDHATIHLDRWHRVYLNAEYTTGHVTFYD